MIREIPSLQTDFVKIRFVIIIVPHHYVGFPPTIVWFYCTTEYLNHPSHL